jgi:hypothetical protein
MFAFDSRFWSDRRVFVIGHTGLKGTLLVLWLTGLGARVTGFSLPLHTDPSLFELCARGRCTDPLGDIADPALIARALADCQPEIVIHMAVQALVRPAYVDPLRTDATNVMRTANLLQAVRATVHVLDSSSGDAPMQNRETVGRGGLDVALEVYDPATTIHKKIGRAISSVESTYYCSLCIDDDVLFTEELGELFSMLDTDPTLEFAHGYYVNFKPGKDFDIWHANYSAPSIVAEDALEQIVQQMSDYQQIFFGVQRTATMKASQPPLDCVRSLWAQESLTSFLTLLAGGMHRMPYRRLASAPVPCHGTGGAAALCGLPGRDPRTSGGRRPLRGIVPAGADRACF